MKVAFNLLFHFPQTCTVQFRHQYHSLSLRPPFFNLAAKKLVSQKLTLIQLKWKICIIDYLLI